MDDITVFESALESFRSTQLDLDAKLQSGQKKLAADFSQLDDLVTAHKSQNAEYLRLRQMLHDLQKVHTHGPKREKLDEMYHSLVEAKCSLDALKSTQPRNDSFFLRLMMGKVNVKVWRRDEQLKFRAEYDKFRERTTYLFNIFPLVQLFLCDHELIWKVHQLWLCYYYCTLALRQNILLINGSNIKAWWIYHHYVSLFLTVLMLNFSPADEYIAPRRRTVLWFGLAQGIIMLLQNFYQVRRSYARVSMGKAQPIDVERSETIVEKPVDLQILVPLLFAIYAFEFYAGCDGILFWFHMNEWVANWEVLTIGLGFLVLAIGNAVTTGMVLLSKQQQRRLSRSLLGRSLKSRSG